MTNKMKALLEEYLPQDIVDPIMERFNSMDLVIKVRTTKGRKKKEVLSKLFKEHGESCSACLSRDPEKKLTLDHIIPKRILLDMGLEEFFGDEENYCILCSNCNSRKGSQLDFSNPKTIPLLEKYTDIYKRRRGIT